MTAKQRLDVFLTKSGLTESRQRAQALIRVADERQRVFGSRQIFLHQDRALGERDAQPLQVVEQRLLVLDHGVLGDALRAVAVARLQQRREHRRQRRALVARTHVRLQRHRHVEPVAPLDANSGTGGRVHHIPGSVRRAEDGDIGIAIAIEIAHHSDERRSEKHHARARLSVGFTIVTFLPPAATPNVRQ